MPPPCFPGLPVFTDAGSLPLGYHVGYKAESPALRALFPTNLNQELTHEYNRNTQRNPVSR